ncbi:MAG: cytochrome c4 [Gammaproteobacteria bacterium]|nr:cytochrome c4 [Gammaproteobacteria bacterium]
MDLVKLSTPALALITLAIAGTAFSGRALAAGSAEAGQAKAATCSACHGMDGNSLNPEWPSLAGQHESYIVKSLQSFKSGTRQNVLMSGMAMPLTDADMEDLAAYFSAQKPAGGVADPALVSAGERLYRGGNKETGVPACLACHGPTGQGNPAAGWPSIAGQHATYSAAQLTAYRAKQRATDGDTQMMRNVAATLTDDEIKAVASYIQGLR